jgi:NDP-sugar pyrophosphorylase family protein
LEKDVLPRILNSSKKIKIYKVTRWNPMDNSNDKSKINNILSKNKNFFKNEY